MLLCDKTVLFALQKLGKLVSHPINEFCGLRNRSYEEICPKSQCLVVETYLQSG